MCFRLCCGCLCPSSSSSGGGNNATKTNIMSTTPEEQQMVDRINAKQQSGQPLTEEELKDYENLIYISNKRQIKVTVKTSVKGGMIAGLCVMSGILVAGPVGAIVGGTIGTAAAANMSTSVITLTQLLEQTPNEKRGEVYRIFQESLKEEFQDGFTENPELRLLLSGGTIMSVMRYCLDRNLIENEKLQKLDAILSKVA